jgi:AraC-like DNA-binding protein
MDALTDLIELLRPRSLLLGGMAASGRWGVQVPPQPGPTFYFVIEGGCWFQADGGDPVELRQGDYVLSARPRTDSFFSAPGVETPVSDDAFKARHTIAGELRLGDPGAVPATRLLGGLILCDPANADLLVGLLPPIVVVRAAESGGARLHILIAMIREEAGGARPGRDPVLARLVEVMLIETLRREAAARLPNVGLLAGLADPGLARALATIHADPARGWTVAGLARTAGMSRSVFANRFAAKVGAAPGEYLLRWRMALARDRLCHGQGSLDEIAAAIGYKSASAFSTAFRQRMGCPPRDYAARLRAAGAAP